MKAQPGRILFLTRGERVPSARFRVEAHLPALRAAGWMCDVAPLRPATNSAPPSWLKALSLGSERLAWRAWLSFQVVSRLRLYWRVRRYNVLFLQKDLTAWPTSWLEKLLIQSTRKGRAKKVILDADDAIWQLYPNPESPENKVNRIAALVDLVLAGNSFSANHFQQFAKRVEVLPTAIDTEHYQPRNPANVDPNRLVWIGSSGGYPELEVLRHPFEELAKSHPALRFRIVADKPPPTSLCPTDTNGQPRLGGIPVDFIRWSKTVEIEALEDAALGLMPLTDTPWNRGKCGFKLLLYLARGVPAMGSALPVNTDILQDQQFLVSSNQNWKEKIENYLNNKNSETAEKVVVCPARYSRRECSAALLKVLGDINER